jgi:inner membrane protein
MALFGGLGCLPDLDVLGFTYHIPYAGQFGHRGASHSLTVAVVAGVLSALVFGGRGRSRLRMGLTAVATVASHGFLDAMTDGGLGVAFFWPFSQQRFLFPWRPIPVAPIGAAFFTHRGFAVFLSELAIFAPFLIYALWPRTVHRAGLEALDDA